MKLRRRGRWNVWLLAAAALFILDALFLVLFHHHSDGLDHSDCAACRLAKEVLSIFVLLAGIFAGLAAQKFFTPLQGKFIPHSFAFNLPNRAPPVLS